jgi:hypothetical protein
MFKRIAIAAVAALLSLAAQAEELTTQNLRQSIELAQRTSQLTDDIIHARSGLMHDVYRNKAAAQEADRRYDILYMHVVEIDGDGPQAASRPPAPPWRAGGPRDAARRNVPPALR